MCVCVCMCVRVCRTLCGSFLHLTITELVKFRQKRNTPSKFWIASALLAPSLIAGFGEGEVCVCACVCVCVFDVLLVRMHVSWLV